MSFPRYCQLRERFELHAPIEVARHCQIRLRSLPLAAVSNQIGFEPFPPSQLGVHLPSNEKAIVRLSCGPDIAVRLTGRLLVTNGVGVVSELG